MAAMVMNLLLNVAMLGEVDGSGIAAPDRLPALQSWEFHDLLFHTRSREGRHDLPMGGTCRFAGKLDLPPALKPPPSCERVELYRKLATSHGYEDHLEGPVDGDGRVLPSFKITNGEVRAYPRENSGERLVAWLLANPAAQTAIA